MAYRTEHPRPDFYRPLWRTLNGTWQFAFDREHRGLPEKWYADGKRLNAEIEVPFCYQSSMSGIGCDELCDTVWYKRTFSVPEEFAGKRVYICFGAVDYAARAYVNGQYLMSHEGGYCPFRVDVTDVLREGENELCLCVEDRPDRQQPRGKQYWKEGWSRCWYTPCTGIWQSVYMEAAGEICLENILITPDIDRAEARVQCVLNAAPKEDTELRLEVFFEGRLYRRVTVLAYAENTFAAVSMVDTEAVEDVRLWSPQDPALYELKVAVLCGGSETDSVTTYFGMRAIEVRDGYILLNHRTCYLRMVLDQGYWPESLLTPPSEEAIKKDIEWTLKLGYNGARKHQKIEDPLYYYWADRMGLLVWGEVPAAYDFTGKALRRTAETVADFIERDMNHPSLIAWVPVNESWGMTRLYANTQMQDAARMLYRECKALDPTRPVSSNDGWETVETDILGLHDYTAAGDALTAHFTDGERMTHYAVDDRMCLSTGFVPTGKEALMVTEYGGIAIDSTGSGWGYNRKAKDTEEYLERLREQTDAIRRVPACRGYCYTQLTDVMQEQNGLLYPDRTPKADPEKIREINRNPDSEKQK